MRIAACSAPTAAGRTAAIASTRRETARGCDSTLRGKRLGLSLAEIKEVVDMYESPRDTVPQLKRLLAMLASHREQMEQQMAELQSTLEEVSTHERETRRMLAEAERKKRARARGSRIDVYVNVNCAIPRCSTPWTPSDLNRTPSIRSTSSACATPSRARPRCDDRRTPRRASSPGASCSR